MIGIHFRMFGDELQLVTIDCSGVVYSRVISSNLEFNVPTKKQITTRKYYSAQMVDGFIAIGSDKNIYLGEVREADFWT